MIRARRSAVDVEGIAAMRGVGVKRIYDLGLLSSDRFPKPISSARSGRRLWDRIQASAAVRGRSVPALPPHTQDPQDLLDRGEAPLILDNPVRPETWDEYVENDPYLRERAVSVCGVIHHRRAHVLAWQSQRPGRGAGAGRKSGSPDSTARASTVEKKERLEKVAEMIERAAADGRALSGADVGRALGVSARTGQRLLADARATSTATHSSAAR